MSKLLVVDDEYRIRQIIKKYAEFEGYEVEEAVDGMQAIELCRRQDFDLIIMDVMMPELDGFSACKEIRKFKSTPIIMLSARGEEYDKIHGFEIGSDDYVVKPFSLAVLYAKAQALLRRSRGMTAAEVLRAGALVLDPARGTVTADGQRIYLPPKEFALLRALMERKNRVLTRDELLNLAWGWDFDGSDRVVDSHIKKLRRALGPHADCIRTVVKRGYKLEVDGDENKT